MTWFKVDDDFADHAKVHRLKVEHPRHWKGALALWTLAGAWCSKHETDGVISMATVRKLDATAREAVALCNVGLWKRDERDESNFVFHEFTEHNPSRSDLEKRRENTKRRVSDWREKHARNAVTDSGSNAAPVPTRPDPSRPDPCASHTQSAGADTGVRVREDPFAASERSSLGARVQTRFRKLYAESHDGLDPAMGGKNVGDFPERLGNTARHRAVDPLALLDQAYIRWAEGGYQGSEEASPYSAFVARFERLLAPAKRKRDVRGAYPEPARDEDFRNPTDLDALFGVSLGEGL